MNTVRTAVAAVLLLIVGIGGYVYIAQPQWPGRSRQNEKILTIGVVTNPPSLDPAWDGFREGMQRRGFEEGKNIRYEIRPVANDVPSTRKIVAELLGRHPAMLYVMGVIAGRAVREETASSAQDVPVVFGVISNPIGVGLVADMKSSGNNLTGITPVSEIIISKRLEIFLDMLPGIKRIVFAWNDPQTSGIENLRNAARTLSVELLEKRVASPDELMNFLQSVPFRSGDAIFRSSDGVGGLSVKRIIALAAEKKVPLAGTNFYDVELGGLMSYGANYRKIGEQASRLAESILKGARPSDLPIELPEQFELAINAATATELGITIPPEILIRADRIVP